jgi:hypothetical protein
MLESIAVGNWVSVVVMPSMVSVVGRAFSSSSNSSIPSTKIVGTADSVPQDSLNYPSWLPIENAVSTTSTFELRLDIDSISG